ncbi:Uncharacterized protein FKW44_019897, partial [Caligus rogercresseyi]
MKPGDHILLRGLHFFEKELRLNSEEYVKIIKDVVAPGSSGWELEGLMSFAQESEPYYISRTTPKWLSENLQDFSPCNFYIWGAVERDINRSASNTLIELQPRITVVLNQLLG